MWYAIFEVYVENVFREIERLNDFEIDGYSPEGSDHRSFKLILFGISHNERENDLVKKEVQSSKIGTSSRSSDDKQTNLPNVSYDTLIAGKMTRGRLSLWEYVGLRGFFFLFFFFDIVISLYCTRHEKISSFLTLSKNRQVSDLHKKENQQNKPTNKQTKRMNGKVTYIACLTGKVVGSNVAH